MGIIDRDKVDGIGVDKIDGEVVLFMYEERHWDSIVTMLLDFEAKVNCYLTFILGGQMTRTPQFSGRTARIELYCQHIPPREVVDSLRAARGHLLTKGIGFRIYMGPDRSFPLNLDLV